MRRVGANQLSQQAASSHGQPYIARTVRAGPLELHLVGRGRLEVVVIFAARLFLVVGLWLAFGLATAKMLGW